MSDEPVVRFETKTAQEDVDDREVDLQDKKDMKAAVDAPKNLGTAPMPAGKDSPVAEAGTGSGRAADAAPVKALGDPGKAL